MRSMPLFITFRALVYGAVIGLGSATVWAEEPTTQERQEQPAATPHDRLLSALKTTAESLRSRSIEAAELPQFGELLALAEAYWQDKSVPLDRRAKYCGLAKARLAEGAAMLRRQEAAAAQAAKRPQAAQPRNTTLAQFGAGAQVGAIGGIQNGNSPTQSAATEAQKLIDLIQTVIRPETWDANGGQGTIKYWSNGHALIIYNTGDVHEKIGGTVGFLRK